MRITLLRHGKPAYELKDTRAREASGDAAGGVGRAVWKRPARWPWVHQSLHRPGASKARLAWPVEVGQGVLGVRGVRTSDKLKRRRPGARSASMRFLDRVRAPGIAYDHAGDLGPIKPRLHEPRRGRAITSLGAPWRRSRRSVSAFGEVLRSGREWICLSKLRTNLTSGYRLEREQWPRPYNAPQHSPLEPCLP